MTVARLESGKTADPAVSTLQRVLGAAGCYLVAYRDDYGELVPYHPDGDKRDRGGRHFPAHVRLRRPGDPYFGSYPDEWWWGWHRLAWSPKDPVVPEWTFSRYRPATPPDELPEGADPWGFPQS